MDGQDVVDRREHFGNAARQAAGAHSDTQARTQEMAQGFACASTSSEPKLSLPPAVQAQRQVYLTRGVVERFGPTTRCKACAGRGGSHAHECRARIEECLAREAQARARTGAQATEVELLSDADVPEELTGYGTEVDDAQTASQEAQAQARQGPAAVPGEPSAGSGAQASSASKPELESREL